uniref:Uncharacterized protein n=1 Tax=Mycetohabitans sp. TaxID=2571162 RepID=A0A6B9HDL8_9BURK|nr:hypothetical protein [Mycetohabitans sp.]
MAISAIYTNLALAAEHLISADHVACPDSPALAIFLHCSQRL